MKNWIKKSMLCVLFACMVGFASMQAQGFTDKTIPAKWWEKVSFSGEYTALSANPNWLLKETVISFSCSEYLETIVSTSPSRYEAIDENFLKIKFGGKISGLDVEDQSFNQYSHTQTMSLLGQCECDSRGKIDSLILVIASLREHVDGGGSGSIVDGGSVKEVDETSDKKEVDETSDKSNCDDCEYYLEIEGANGTLLNARSNVREAIVETAKQLCCLAEKATPTPLPLQNSLPNASQISEEDKGKDEEIVESRFSPTFGLNLMPFNEALFGYAGVRYQLYDQDLSVVGGIAAGWKRFGQTSQIFEQTNGDILVDVSAPTKRYLGLHLGVISQMTPKLDIVASATIWGLDFSDFFLSAGATWEIKQNVNVGLAVNLGENFVGGSIPFRF